MKYIKGFICIICTTIVLNINAQNGETKTYTGGTITYKQGKGSTTDIPLGKNVKLTYDTFFKSYNVSFTDVNGYTKTMLFEYISPGNYVWDGTQFMCMSGLLSKYGTISFSDVQRFGTYLSFYITGLKLKK